MSDEDEKEVELDLNSFGHDNDDELAPGVDSAVEDLAGLGLHVVGEDGEAVTEDEDDIKEFMRSEDEY